MDSALKIAVVLGAVDKMSSVISNAVGKSQKEMEKLGRTARISESMNKWGDRAMVAGAAMTGFFASTVAAAADVEKMQISLNTAFQGNQEEARKAFQTINEFAAKTPFQLEEVMSSFVKLKNMGLDPSNAALESYGNTASAMGKSLNDMIEAVADATTGEFERLKEFGIKAKSEGDKVTFTFRGVQTTMRKDAASIEAYLMNIGQTQFAGGIEAQSKSISGQFSTLQDNFKMASAALGKALIPALTKLMQAITPVIEKVAAWAEKNPELVATIAVAGAVLLALGVALKVAAAAMVVFNAALWANPITWIVAAVIAAIAAVVAMVVKWKELVAWFKQTSPIVKLMLAPVISAFAPLILLAFLIRKVIDNWGNMGKWFTNLWERTKQVFHNAVNWIKNLFLNYTPVGLIYQHWSKIVDFFSNLWGNVKGVFMGWVNFVQSLGKIFYEAGANIINSIWEGMKAMAYKPVQAMEEMATKMREYLPFSPAKAGPLRDIHRVKIMETIAESVRPAALTNRMNTAMRSVRGTIDANLNIGRPSTPALALAGGSGTINYSPQVTINGGGHEAEMNFRRMLNEHKDEIVRLMQREQDRKARTRF